MSGTYHHTQRMVCSHACMHFMIVASRQHTHTCLTHSCTDYSHVRRYRIAWYRHYSYVQTRQTRRHHDVGSWGRRQQSRRWSPAQHAEQRYDVKHRFMHPHHHDHDCMQQPHMHGMLTHRCRTSIQSHIRRKWWFETRLSWFPFQRFDESRLFSTDVGTIPATHVHVEIVSRFSSVLTDQALAWHATRQHT